MKKSFTKQFEWVMGMTGSTSCFSPTRRLLLLLCLILVGVGGTKAQSDVTFNDGVRYSQWVIDSRMNDFYANTTHCGFAVYNQSGTRTAERVDGKTKLDYVVGLVAKSIIEASQYYSKFTWAESFAKPWFLSIQNYGDYFYSKFETNGGSLDDLNAVKLFIPLRAMTATDGKYPNTKTYGYTTSALDNAITGLNAHNTNYRIKDNNILAKTAGNDVIGGWWHKSTYENQMWLDGAYMGPALFAELVNYSGTTKNIDSSNDWDLIVKQFTILRNMCWNETDKLPYHAFAADGGTNSTSHSDTWAGLSSTSPYVFHSASYWGRAVGWYFLALVDILEQMEKANIPSTDSKFTTLKGYLEETAKGIKDRQDQDTGGWYQILDETDTYSASEYNNGKSHTTTNNYIESSATALFTAAYLKAIRLGYLAENDYKTVAVNGYKCLVNNFFSVDENGKVNIFGSCRSAGLGGSGDNYKAGKERYRDGSKEYYLLGYDVAKVEKTENKTEGKVLGAFIMAATEYEIANPKDIRFSYDLAPAYDLAQGGSITAEALGSGTITYQWFNASDNSLVYDGQTFAPTESGTYYCKATNESTTIQTSKTDVTVSETVTPSESTNSVVWTFTSSTLTSGTLGTAGNKVTFTSTDGSKTVMTYFSGSKDEIKSLTTTISDVEYSSYLRENGTGSVDGNRRMEFNAPSSKGTVTIVYAETAGTTKVIDGSNGNKELATLNGTENTPAKTDVLTTTVGNKIIIYCPAKSYIYSVIWTPINETSGGETTEYTVTLNATDVTGYPRNMTYSGTALDLPTPEKTGYTFDGWYTAETGGNKVDNPYTPTADNIPLYAKWTKNTYTVTATAEHGNVTITDGSGTQITSGSQVEHGTRLTFTASPNAGYEFSDWTVTGTTGTESSTGSSYVYTIASLTQATEVTANFTATSSGGGETGGSVTGDVIYFTSGKTSSDEKVLKVNVGNATEVSVNYGDDKYTNGVKMESSTDITLTLKAESKVTFVFDTANKKFKIDETSYTTNESGTYTITLAAGTYKIKKDDTGVALVAVDIQPTGPSMSISTQPVSADYLQNATPDALSVAASIVNGTTGDYAFLYQWYSNDKESTTGSTRIGDPTIEPSYTPDVTEIGTKYYYCVVTATKGTEVLTATSDFAKVTVNGPTVTFTTQPQGAVYTRSDSETAAALTVDATTNFSGTVSYQWYKNTTGTIPNPVDPNEKIPNAVLANYTPSINTVGKTYYYCIASSTYNSKDYTAVSDLVCVEVVTALYSYNVQGKTQPKCNESRYIEDGSGNKLVKFTFGGWKYNNNKYLKPNADDIDANYITDEWSAPSTQAKVNALDGYEYAISGKNDAVQENKADTITKYKKLRYGWFESPKRDANGVTTVSHPYTLPVRGAYMTFEPTQNGTLTIYLLQNGAWNSDTKKNIDIIPGEFRMHAFQITNQRGLVLAEFAPKYSITTNQKVADGYSCSKYLEKDKPTSFEKTSKDVSNWEEFWALKETERKAVHDNWNNGNNGSQTIIKLEDGSFLAIQKAIVKYEFHVTGNETYYLFSNFSKLGFSGATFQPDAQPQKTVEDKISTLELRDVTAYNKITAAPTGSTIEGTTLKDYTYSINGKDIAPVAGVSIPQFYSIKLTRTFTKDQWTTLTLPFNLTEEEVQKIFGDGTQLIQLNNAKVDNGCVKLEFIYHEIQNVLPGHPYLIKPTLTDITNDANVTVIKDNNTITNFTVFSKCVNPFISQVDIDCDAYTFKGIKDYCTANVTSTSNTTNWSVNFKKNDIFVSDGDGKLYVSGGSSYGKGYRAWFEKKVDTTDTTSGKINSISLVIDNPGDDDDNVVTTIDMVDVDPDVFNALGIATGVYNLNGQKVSDDMRSLPKGIYIVNGKKIVRK